MGETHSHDLSSWPFADPESVAAICCVHILDNVRPILRVTHDEDDGGWQVLCGFEHDGSEARVVCLGCIIERDPSLMELADLPLGWGAARQSTSEPWLRSANPAALQ
jgi:hypothetical protein